MKFEKGSTNKARLIATEWIEQRLSSLKSMISIGLPEYDDRLKKWRVPLHSYNGKHILVGEIIMSEDIQTIVETTDVRIIKKRILKNEKIV